MEIFRVLEERKKNGKSAFFLLKMKAFMPSLREKKRYLAFEIISKSKVTDITKITKTIFSHTGKYLGELGMAKAGLQVLQDKFDNKKQRGLIRVNHLSLDPLRTALAYIQSIDGVPVIVRSVGASGILKKAYTNYINEV